MLELPGRVCMAEGGVCGGEAAGRSARAEPRGEERECVCTAGGRTPSCVANGKPRRLAGLSEPVLRLVRVQCDDAAVAGAGWSACGVGAAACADGDCMSVCVLYGVCRVWANSSP